MAHPKVDSKSLITYISYFRNAELLPAANLADQCSAYGPGLTEAIVEDEAPFVVETPADAGKLEIKVEGPSSTANVKVNRLPGQGPNGGDKYEVSYKPTEPGEYKVHVTLDGEHIPGSIFHVTVLEQVSLGGEGKVSVRCRGSSDGPRLTRPWLPFRSPHSNPISRLFIVHPHRSCRSACTIRPRRHPKSIERKRGCCRTCWSSAKL